jgi:dethiobiotin synthetase
MPLDFWRANLRLGFLMGRRLMIAGAAGADMAAATVACAIAFAMAARGTRVGVMKPVETGCAGGAGALEPAGARALALAASCDLPLDLICPYRYRAALPPPTAADADRAEPPSFRAIVDALGRIAAARDAVIVDAAGGLALPLTHDADYADLAAAAGLEVVLVAANDSSRLEHAMLALRYAKSRSLRLAGVILADLVPDASPDESAAALAAAAGPSYLGRMRFREPLKLDIIERLL